MDNWGLKVEVVKHLNSGEPYKAVKLALSHKDFIDDQFVEIFANGISLRLSQEDVSELKSIEDFKDTIESWENKNISVRAFLRLSCLKQVLYG